MESNYRCAGFQYAGEFSARTRNFRVSKLTLVTSASLKLPPLRVGRAILAIASHEDPKRLGARIRSQHMVARAGRAVTESNPPWNGADTGIFSPPCLEIRLQIQELSEQDARSMQYRARPCITDSRKIHAGYPKHCRGRSSPGTSVARIPRRLLRVLADDRASG